MGGGSLFMYTSLISWIPSSCSSQRMDGVHSHLLPAPNRWRRGVGHMDEMDAQLMGRDDCREYAVQAAAGFFSSNHDIANPLRRGGQKDSKGQFDDIYPKVSV